MEAHNKMKITKVMVNRKFNLGGYESLDMAAEAELNETDNPLEIWNIIRDNIEMCFTDMQRKKQAEKGGVNSSVTQPATATAPSPQPSPPLLEKFTQKQRDLLTVKNGSIYPKEYIEDKFAWIAINVTAEAQGYKWVKAGDQSHWSKTA